MTFADDHREAIYQLFEDVSDAEEKLLALRERLKDISNKAQMLSNNEAAKNIAALVALNQDHLRKVRQGHSEMKKAIEDWWKNV